MNEPLVSLIIPAYNRAALLPATLASVFAEDYPAKEIIVVDDGSTDETAAVCARFPVRFFHQKNRGPGAARNFGAAQSRGELLVFLDSDDICPAGSLRQRVEHWQRDPHYAQVTGRLRLFQEDTPGRMIFIHAENEAVHCVSNGSDVILRHAFEKAGGFDENLRSWEDWELWMRLRELGFQQKLIPETCLFYRRHAGNMSEDRVQANHGILAMLHGTMQRRRRQQLRASL